MRASWGRTASRSAVATPAVTRPTRSWAGPTRVPASRSGRPSRSRIWRSRTRLADRAQPRPRRRPERERMTETPDLTCDLLVIGSGAGGLSAAVTAAWLGLDVLVLEKEKEFGGTTAWSGGWLWIPRNP